MGGNLGKCQKCPMAGEDRSIAGGINTSAVVNDLCAAFFITGAQHTLAGSEYGSQTGIECYPSDIDGITAATTRAHINARRQGDEPPTILIADTGGSQVQQAIRQAQVSGRHVQLYILAAGQVTSAQAPSTTEISCVAHKTWGHRAMSNMSRVSAVGWPWCVDGIGSRFAQVIMASPRIGPDDSRTTEAPLIRVVGLPPMEVHEIRIAATEELEDYVVTAITRAQTMADRNGLTFKWTTSQFRRRRVMGGNHPGAFQMAVHNVEIRAEWGGAERSEPGARAIRDINDEIIDLQNSIAGVQTEAIILDLTSGRANVSEWCVAWTNGELGQAVHAPMNKNQTYNALLGMQPLADRFGAKAVPVETGVAIIGCAPAIANAVLQGWPQPTGRIHLPRRISTCRTHSDHETDVRLSSPSAGHDLTWIAATGGQIHPSTIATVLYDVLGEYPTTESACALNPGTQAEQMIQVTVPAHLRQRMLMGPGADGATYINRRKELQSLPIHGNQATGTTQSKR